MRKNRIISRCCLLFLLNLLIYVNAARKKRSSSSDSLSIPKFDVYTLESLLSSLPRETATSGRTKPLIIDCFEYVKEPITLFRIAYLWDVVDLFIIMEMKGSSTGAVYQMDSDESSILRRLEKEKKLLKMRIDEFPYDFKYRQNTTKSDFFLFRMTPYHFRDTRIKHSGLLHLARQKYLIDSFFHEFKKKFMDKSYILIFGKNNEIPRKEILKQLPNLYGHPALAVGLRLEMPTFYYNFKWMVPEERVRSTTIFQDTGFQELSSLTDLLWFGNEKLPLIFRSGWRCSFFKTSSALVKDIKLNYPEYNIPEIVNQTWLDSCIERGYDLFMRRYIFISLYDGSEKYPSCSSCANEIPQYSLFHLPSI